MTELLVAPAWLAEHLDDVIVVDVRWSPTGGTAAAEHAFAAGHIPGAVFLDIDRDLAATPFIDGPGRHPLPTPSAFTEVLAANGIGDDDLVVAYDDVRGSVAARLWWMLDATGRRAALLDGGLAAWPGAIEEGTGRTRPRTDPEVRPWPAERLADAEAVAKGIDTGAPVFDARAAERFRGETEPIDPVAGHIPGARSAPWADNVDDEGRFRPADALAERYRGFGAGDADAAIVYCGSGVTSCHDLFAMRLAGLGDARLYEGSWSGWISDRERPVAVGDDG
jgi:thiosulfate/3-mercaptopyruvate sulfurtransferase